MNGNSLTPEQEKLHALRQILPEVFSEGKIQKLNLKRYSYASKYKNRRI